MENCNFDVSKLMNNQDITVWVKLNKVVDVEVKYVTRQKFAELARQATKTVWDRNNQPVETFDNIKFGELLGVETVKDWSGLINDGEILPCTPENITLLMARWFDFAKFVSSICTDLERLIELQKEVERKN